MLRLFQIMLLGLAFLSPAPRVVAQDITLRSADGAVTISGTLLGYDGEFYKIRSNYGDMTLNGTGVICVGHACPNPAEFATTVEISVSRSMGENLLPALIEDYAFRIGHAVEKQAEKDGTWDFFVADSAGFAVATVHMSLTNLNQGFSNLIDQGADLNVSFRPVERSEIHRAISAGIGNLSSEDHRHILALDGLVFISSPENDLRALTLTEIDRIFSGRIKNWGELGGADAPIVLYLRNPDADLTGMFRAQIWKDDPKKEFAPGQLVGSNAALSDRVTADPFALGFTNFANIRNARALALRGPCGQEIIASPFSLKTEDYPFTQHLYLYRSNVRQAGFMRGFMAYLETAAAQKTIADIGYVGRDVTVLPLDMQGNRLGNAIAESNNINDFKSLQAIARLLSGAHRLSTTFRFKEFSTGLDARSLTNATQLARLVELGEFDGKTLILAGFSDGQGSSAGNKAISLRRSKLVAGAIRSAATKADLSKIRFEVAGFGEVMPIGCDDSDWGKRINRRVEVWVK